MKKSNEQLRAMIDKNNREAAAKKEKAEAYQRSLKPILNDLSKWILKYESFPSIVEKATFLRRRLVKQNHPISINDALKQRAVILKIIQEIPHWKQPKN